METKSKGSNVTTKSGGVGGGNKLRAAKVGLLAAMAGGGAALLGYKVLQARAKKHADTIGCKEAWYESLCSFGQEPENYSQDEDLFNLFGAMWLRCEKNPTSYHSTKQALLAVDSLLRIEYVLENKDAEPTLLDVDRAMTLTAFIINHLTNVTNSRVFKAFNLVDCIKNNIQRSIIKHTMRINSLVYDCD